MSINEDYAGGSYKTNSELESDIEDLQAQLSAVRDKVQDLENDIEALKNFIRQEVEQGPNNDSQFKGWEVFNLLSNWAQRES